MQTRSTTHATRGLAVLALVAWASTCVLGFTLMAPWVGSIAEGIGRSYLSPIPLIATGASLLCALVATVVWASRTRAVASPSSAAFLERRGLLLTGLAAGTAATAAAVIGRNAAWIHTTGMAVGTSTPTESDPKDVQASWRDATIQSYRRLGRTEARVSDISLGSASISPESGGEELARRALDRGINYFDTAPDYTAAGSEIALGRAMKGRRDKLFLATKFCTPRGHVPAGASVAEYMRVVEESLTRLQTDYVDLIHVHSCNSVERLLDPAVHEAFDRLREQGKARFLGVSTHTPRLQEVADAAIASRRFDVLMLAYHHGAWPQLGDIIQRAAAADIGVVAMKTLKGAHHEGLLELTQQERSSYPQAAFRWVLSNPDVSSLVISFRKPQHLDEYIAASGQTPKQPDTALLARYDREIAGKHCFQHCGACLDACPENVPIDDVLRHRMYFESYGDQKEAMRLYSLLPKQADACASCAAPCLNACPFGIPIAERTREAHHLLS